MEGVLQIEKEKEKETEKEIAALKAMVESLQREIDVAKKVSEPPGSPAVKQMPQSPLPELWSSRRQ